MGTDETPTEPVNQQLAKKRGGLMKIFIVVAVIFLIAFGIYVAIPYLVSDDRVVVGSGKYEHLITDPMCIAYFQGPDICETLHTPEDIEECFNEYYVSNAIKTNDVSQCESITNEIKDFCIGFLSSGCSSQTGEAATICAGAQTQDISVCSNLGDLKPYCESQILKISAIKSSDFSICESVPLPEERARCKAFSNKESLCGIRVFSNNQDPTLDELIALAYS